MPDLPVRMTGVVTPFKGNGRKFGYPTANIRSDTDLQDGVYFGFADLAQYQQQPAMIFIGTPTTVGDTERRVEAYLFDVEDKDYYDVPLTLSIETFHRANETFESVEKLLEIMKNDEATARSWFAAHRS